MQTNNRLTEYLKAHPKLCQVVEMSFDISHGAGAWYVGHMINEPERIASVHVAVWDRNGLGRHAASRVSAARFMAEYNVNRIIAEIPVSNFLAQAFAQRVGMRRIGVLKQRPLSDGSKTDVVMFEAIRGEL